LFYICFDIQIEEFRKINHIINCS